MSRYVRIALVALLLATLPLRSADIAPGANDRKQNSLIDAPEVAIRKFTVAPGLKVDLFAAEPDVRNPVAISIDEHGRVFVVESDRRRSSVFDIRGHKDWLESDFSFRTVSNRADFLRAQVSPTNPAAIKRLAGGGNGNLADFNKDGVIDWRDLEVQSERIRLLEDTDGDGRADRVSVFADGFTNIVAGVAAGVLAQRGDVYFACIPDLWKMPGTPLTPPSPLGGERVPEGRVRGAATNILSGFGVHIAFGGHDMHGLIFGPDGKLYWSIADRGTDTNLFAKLKNPAPGLTPELLADSGCVFRANPDGSDFEVVAWGLRNPQELAFDDFGNLFTADNNGDGGDKARWHYVVEGADFGWRIGWQWLEARAYQPKMGPWNGERLWHLAESNTAAYLLAPLAHIGHGPAGLAFNPGTGLPTSFDRHFFLCDFPGAVLMWTNIPDGASFKVGPVKNLFGDLGPTDVAFHPDGGVLVSDWFKSFDKSDKGRIYRIHDPATDASAAVQETKRLLAEGMSKRSVKELAELLGHRDMRVRLEAQWEMRARTLANPFAFARATSEIDELCTLALSGTNLLARLHAIWAVGPVVLRYAGDARFNPRLELLSLINDGNAEIRAQAIKLFWLDGSWPSGWPIIDSPARFLRDPSMRVRFFAAMAVAKVGSGSDLKALVDLLRSDAGRDPYIVHAVSLAIARLVPSPNFARIGGVDLALGYQSAASLRLSDDQSSQVRLALLLGLRRVIASTKGVSPTRPQFFNLGPVIPDFPNEIARFLNDSDPQIVLEAARAINDVPIPEAYPQLAALIGTDGRPSLDSARTVPPHPGPLPRGEGETSAAAGQNGRVGNDGTRSAKPPLLGEKAPLDSARAASPHPGPLPKGEGEKSAAAGQNGRVGNDGTRNANLPLLGERAGVRADQSSEISNLTSETVFFTLRRALNASFRIGHATNALALAAFAARSDAPEPLRIEALELLGLWGKPPARDHFMGLYRPLPAREGKPAADALRPVLASLLGSAPKDVKVQATKAAAALGVKEADLFALVSDVNQAPEVRVEALKTLAEQKDARLPEALQLALADKSEALRIEAGKLRGGGDDASAQWVKILESGGIAEKQGVFASLATAKGMTADDLLTKQLDALLAGTLAKELTLDVLDAAKKNSSDAIVSRVKKYEASLPKNDALAPWRAALYGGNAEEGKKVFVENQNVACFRCHKINGEGGEVGPDLTGVGAKRGREYLLESIVFPNKEVAPGFEQALITLKSGTEYAGMVKGETDAEVSLLSAEDGLVKIPKADIKARLKGLSAMPEELGNVLTRRELRDVIQFLDLSR